MRRARSGGVGERELALLHWVAERGSAAERAGATVGEAAEGFGAAAGLARSTVQTMLERLHDKGYLRRRRQQGIYRYAAAQGSGELLRGLVHSFVEGTLGGSLSPFVAYLVEEGAASAAERAALERLVERLEERRGEP